MLTTIKAIRKKCLDCCCGQHWEVRLCARTDCPLYPYRMGSRPKTKELLARMNDENDDSNSTE